MIHISKISESIKNDISVLDIEDYLQEVWDNHRSLIDGYLISRNFIDDDFVLSTGDQSVSMGEDIKYENVVKGDNQKYIFDIVIFVDRKMHSQLGDWGESGFFDMNNLIDTLSSIRKCLSRISKNPSIAFDSEESQSPEIEITISFIPEI